jgi:cytochrome c5
MKKLILMIVLLFINYSCSSKKVVTSTSNEIKTETDATEFSQVSTTNRIELGKSIYENNCAKCHDLPNIKAYSITAWQPILIKMQKKAKLSDQEREQINDYIKNN